MDQEQAREAVRETPGGVGGRMADNGGGDSKEAGARDQDAWANKRIIKWIHPFIHLKIFFPLHFSLYLCYRLFWGRGRWAFVPPSDSIRSDPISFSLGRIESLGYVSLGCTDFASVDLCGKPQ